MLNTHTNPAPKLHPFFQRKSALEKLPQTQRGFENLLDELRPTADKVETAIQYGKDGAIGAFVYGDEKLIHIVETVKQSEDLFLMELDDLVQFYKHPPRLWPGCRGVIARQYGLKMTVEFNRWFDNFANVEPH